MIIHNKFIGGNIFVDRMEGQHVYLRNEQRDTVAVNGKDRFYWAFVVEGAERQELTFHFGKRRLGIWGPAVSHDLVEWHWLDQNEDNTFTYKFGEDESKVYFAHHILYHPAHFDDFVKRNRLTAQEFCKSRKGHSVPCLQLGEGKRSIILTARHHACESISNYLLEGLIEELMQRPLADTRILVVPFIDYDGVVDGDQGKNRYPHDQNRDYIDEPIYPEIRALIAYAEAHGCHYGFDFHSPGHSDKRIFLMNTVKPDRLNRFSDILAEEYLEGGLRYEPEKQPDGKLAERKMSAGTFSSYMNQRPENVLALTLETTYTGSSVYKLTPTSLRIFGKSFANAIRRFVDETDF